MTTQQYLLQQRDNGMNVSSFKPTITLHSTEIPSQSTSILVNAASSTGNNAHQRGSGINRMSCKK